MCIFVGHSQPIFLQTPPLSFNNFSSISTSHLINTLQKMANARIARFVSEAAPSQFVNVMRNRASKMLETIKEDDKEASNETSSISPKSSSSSMKSKYFVEKVQMSFPLFGNKSSS